MTEHLDEKRYFNDAMDYIDKLICDPDFININGTKHIADISTELRKKFPKRDIGSIINSHTEQGIKNYIEQRRNYLAAYEIQSTYKIINDQSLTKIAEKYGYSNSADLTNQIKSAYGVPPKELSIKNGKNIKLEDNKLSWDKLTQYNTIPNFVEEAKNSFNTFTFKNGHLISPYNNFISDFYHCLEEYPFNYDEGQGIANLAKYLNISMVGLFQACYELRMEEEELKFEYGEERQKKNYNNDRITPGQLIQICFKEANLDPNKEYSDIFSLSPDKITEETIKKYKGDNNNE